jgi:hypothetical protein
MLDVDKSTIYRQKNAPDAASWELLWALRGLIAEADAETERRTLAARQVPFRTVPLVARTGPAATLALSPPHLGGLPMATEWVRGSERWGVVEAGEASETADVEEGDFLLCDMDRLPSTGEVCFAAILGKPEVRRVEHPRGRGRRLVGDNGWDDYGDAEMVATVTKKIRVSDVG